MSADPQPREILSVKMAAELMGVSDRRVRRWITAGTRNRGRTIKLRAAPLGWAKSDATEAKRPRQRYLIRLVWIHDFLEALADAENAPAPPKATRKRVKYDPATSGPDGLWPKPVFKKEDDGRPWAPPGR